jgi:hypothetical protein
VKDQDIDAIRLTSFPSHRQVGNLHGRAWLKHLVLLPMAMTAAFLRDLVVGRS